MSDYSISEIRKNDRYAVSQMDALLKEEGIRRDGNLDYSCGLYDEDYELVGTGSCFGNTLRCLAVSHAHQGEGLMNEIVTHLINVQFARGNTHLFVYTKCSSAKFFADLGFREIVRIEDQVVFMENSWSGFDSYLKKLKDETARQISAMPGPDSGSAPAAEGTAAAGTETAAVVMNANPFTLGHRYLVEKAASENRLLHLFIVSEDASLVPFSVRKQLVMEGTAGLKNIVYHDSGPYIISSATFPSYFQKDSDAVIESHARLDIDIFSRIAAALGITRRYVGEEPFSVVTSAYNRIMGEVLPQHNVALERIRRCRDQRLHCPHRDQGGKLASAGDPGAGEHPPLLPERRGRRSQGKDPRRGKRGALLKFPPYHSGKQRGLPHHKNFFCDCGSPFWGLDPTSGPCPGVLRTPYSRRGASAWSGAGRCPRPEKRLPPAFPGPKTPHRR